MAYSLIAHVEASPGSNGGATGNIDTSGADLIIIGTSLYNPGMLTTVTESDSKGNTWIDIGSPEGTNPLFIQWWYCRNPSVGSGHNFTVSGSGTYPSIFVMAFSGVGAAPPLDQENDNINTGTTVTSGSITPTEDNELCVTLAGMDSSTSHSVDSGFTAYTLGWVNSVNVGGGMAYKIQTTAAAVNPEWTGSASSSYYVARIASFKAAAGGGGGVKLSYWAWQQYGGPTINV